MAKLYNVITYDYGYSGEIIVYVNGNRYCTCDNWKEYRQVRNEILSQNIFSLECV